MGSESGRTLELAALTLLALVACGGRALTYDDGAAGKSAIAGAGGANNGASGSSNRAGAPSGGAGASDGDPLTNCAYDEDCVVVPNRCCAHEPMDSTQLIALSSAYSADYQPPEDCHHSCPASPPVTEYDQTQKYFRGICFHDPASGPNRPGKCQIMDVRGTAYSTCVTSSDCTLREGVSCCPGCDGQGWVPVNSKIDFCSVSTACGHCISFPPAGLETSCQAGTCRFAPPKR